MLATALTFLVTALLLAVAVILIVKSRRTHDPGFIWLAVAVAIWPIVSRLLERRLGSPAASPLNLIQQFVGVCILSIAVLRPAERKRKYIRKVDFQAGTSRICRKSVSTWKRYLRTGLTSISFSPQVFWRFCLMNITNG